MPNSNNFKDHFGENFYVRFGCLKQHFCQPGEGGAPNIITGNLCGDPVYCGAIERGDKLISYWCDEKATKWGGI